VLSQREGGDVILIWDKDVCGGSKIARPGARGSGATGATFGVRAEARVVLRPPSAGRAATGGRRPHRMGQGEAVIHLARQGQRRLDDGRTARCGWRQMRADYAADAPLE
jgi:hypothetical protein